METAEGRAVAPDGTAIAYRSTGEGDALLLVHSAAADARVWSRLTPHLAGSFRVVAMDRRGRGASGPFGDGHSLEVEYGDVAAVADALPGPIHLLGHSSGARFALHAATRIPRLATLLLYEPPAAEHLPDDLVEALFRRRAEGDREGVLRHFFVDAVGMGDDDFAALRRRPVWPLMVDNALAMPEELSAARRYRFDPADVASIGVPALLLLGGESDDAVAAAAYEVAAALPDATVRVLPGQGHGAMLSAPEMLADRIRRFVAARR